MARNQGKSTNVNWGICTNTSGKEDGTPCSKCQNKEKQAIRATKDFVCEECHEPLTKIAPPKKTPWALIGGIAAVVVAALVLVLCLRTCSKKDTGSRPGGDGTDTTEVVGDNPQTGQDKDTGTVETTPGGDSGGSTIKKTKNDEDSGKGSQPRNPVATYNGPTKGGKPHGFGGTLTFKKSYPLDLKDGNGTIIYLKPGESIHNTKFENGVLRQGEVHFNNGDRQLCPALSSDFRGIVACI
jgi:hypothetical protein